MTSTVETLPMGVSVAEAAEKMKELGVGFLPVSDSTGEKLAGVTTDRDIVIRCVAERNDPNGATIDEVMTDRTLYCFADDELGAAADIMARERVYRLVVLDDSERKNLAGIITLSDILRVDESDMALRAARHIAESG